MISNSAKNITRMLGFLNAKKFVEKSFKNPPRTTKTVVPKKILSKFVVSEFQVMGKSVITIQPKQNDGNKHVIYFHGGAYLLEGSTMHWKIIDRIATKANCKISYFDYPLAPEFNYISTFEMVQQAYNKIKRQYSEDQFLLMGDSAGGGLALAFAQKLAIENPSEIPPKNILFSPWLDISMSNPLIKDLEHLDKLLPLSGLIEAGKKYAGNDNVDNYLLSPINGKLDGLGDTIVFYGTHELFYADCKKLKELSKSSIVKFIFHEYAEMQHDWVLYPIPEANQVINTTIEFIND
ncbi:MAG: alpha/beta hydrolase fold domain-containing protein [Paludibacter sp.]